MKDMYPELRRQEVLQQVNRDGKVAVTELSQKFGVSEVTIRNDLQALAEQNLIIRTHGGAIPAGLLPELSLKLRRQQHVAEKDRIGEQAASLISDGESIFLDSSSTALAIVRYIKNHQDLTIITNSLAVAQAAGELSHLTVVMTGGIYKRDTVSLVGMDGVEIIRKFNIQKGFFGAHGLNFPEGLTDVSASEAEVKHSIVKMCREVIAVIDGSKWGQVGLASFARMEEVRVVITDHLPPSDLSERAAALGIEIYSV
jgi:DeoR/GlpR family transcriptional regulator of sugar metabolism